MELEHLVKMANQIGVNFRLEPDRAGAIDSIGGHMKRFWDPRMLKQIVALYESGGEGIDDMVKQAIQKHLLPARPSN